MRETSKTAGQTRTAAAVKTLKARGQHKKNAATGVVRADESFDIEAFCARLGTTANNVVEMRRKGLKARNNGGRLAILGSDYHAYLGTLPVAEVKQRSIAKA